jgi:hypothetical protein
MFYGHLLNFLVILVYFSRFGMLYQEKSGNLGVGKADKETNGKTLLQFVFVGTSFKAISAMSIHLRFAAVWGANVMIAIFGDFRQTSAISLITI